VTAALLASMTLVALLGAVLATALRRADRRARRDAAEIDRLRREVSGLERGRAELEKLSVTDPLTGVWNYRYLQLALNWEIERASRFAHPLSVLILDPDHFAGVNDRYGHPRGNVILREFAQRVVLETRQIDTLGRYGGDEFVLILPETGAEGAATVAERLCYAVRKQSFGRAPEEPARLTVSVGIAVYPAHGNHASTLLRRADQALYRAKRAGRDGWRTAVDTDASAADGGSGSPADAGPDDPRR
jgi:diguanylate cyclase (GGDEF)-like protein